MQTEVWKIIFHVVGFKVSWAPENDVKTYILERYNMSTYQISLRYVSADMDKNYLSPKHRVVGLSDNKNEFYRRLYILFAKILSQWWRQNTSRVTVYHISNLIQEIYITETLFQSINTL
jgi:hypothetical protein